MVNHIDIDITIDKIAQELESGEWSPANEMLKKGFSTSYENEEGILVEEFPDGRIFRIDMDLATGETIYLERLQ
jgi:hypothetical protein